MAKAPIEVIGMGEPFSDPHGHNILYRYVTEKHRDGRIRTVLRGRDFRQTGPKRRQDDGRSI